MFIEGIGGVRGLVVCGPQSPRLLNLYFRRCYNSIEGLSEGYIQLLLETSRQLPKSGLIYDCGGGPGNFSAALLFLSAQRRVRLFDMSSQAIAIAIAIARETATRFGVQERLSITKKNLRSDFATEGSADGIVVNNVLYTLGGYGRKLSFLNKLHSVLKPGGILVLNDPNTEFQKNASCHEHLRRVLSSAAYHKSPMTAFDVALYTEINRKVLGGKSAPFLRANDLVSLAHRAGFALIETPETRFYGIDTFLVLRRIA